MSAKLYSERGSGTIPISFSVVLTKPLRNFSDRVASFEYLSDRFGLEFRGITLAAHSNSSYALIIELGVFTTLGEVHTITTGRVVT